MFFLIEEKVMKPQYLFSAQHTLLLSSTSLVLNVLCLLPLSPALITYNNKSGVYPFYPWAFVRLIILTVGHLLSSILRGLDICKCGRFYPLFYGLLLYHLYHGSKRRRTNEVYMALPSTVTNLVALFLSW